MSIESDYTLSHYREIAKLHKQRDVHIVQHINSQRIFVKKRLSVFDVSVYHFMKANPHAGIPRVYETFVVADQLIVIEEYINGTSVQDMLTKWIVLNEQLAKAVVLQLCDILDWLHNSDPPIIHRDIKPENLIYTDEGNLYLIDFNAAKKSQEAKTRDTVLIGTAGYAAPEQYGFASSNAQTDIYAVGILLNELLTGKHISEEIYTCQPKHPSQAGSPPNPDGLSRPDLASQPSQANSTPRSDLASRRSQSIPWHAIITECTAFDPEDRYENIKQLKKALLKQDWRFKVPDNIRDYLLPGFRTRTPWKIIVSIIGYISYAMISFSIELEGNHTLFELWSYRIAIFAIFIGITLFIGNYLNIHSTLPLTSSNNRIIKSIGIFIGSSFIIFLLMFVFIIIEILPF